MIDRSKLQRITGDLQQLRVTLSGVASDYREAAARHTDLKADVVRGLNTRHPSDLWNSSHEIADLLKLPPAELDRLRVDVPTARAAVAERDRMHDLKRRLDALEQQASPLAALVTRLTAYASENN